MSSLREIKDRIGSVRSTLKITSAMKLVASAKLHKAQQAVEALRPYEATLSSILADVREDGREGRLVGPQGLDGLLRLVELGGGDELHRRSYLQRGAYRPDPVFYFA